MVNDRPEHAALDSHGIASLVLGPDWNPIEGAAVLRSAWSRLEQSSRVKAVKVIASSAGQHCPVLFPRDEDRGSLGPKTNGLLKPFGVAIRGPARNAILELIAEADVVVATADASFADSSMFHGLTPVHSINLKKMLPDSEVSRIALLGDKQPMSSARALELHLIDALATEDELEPELDRRLKRLAPAG